MGYLDFAPEPPAPSATPVKVTESVDLNCTPNNDARDLSSKNFFSTSSSSSSSSSVFHSA